MTSGGTMFYGEGSTAYVNTIRRVLMDGAIVSPRGMPCRELSNATIVIANAAEAVPLDTGRALSMKIGSTEYCQLLAGVSSLSQLNACATQKHDTFSQYADNGRLRGAYGPRVYSQLPWVAGLLHTDPDTRQAVITVWGRQELAAPPRRDMPCTVSLQFQRRGGKLNLAVMMRSSDMWLGVPYDWWQFSRLQMTMAWTLGIPAGSFTFFAGSLHVYERNAAAVKKLARGGLPAAQPPAVTGANSTVVSPVARMHIAQDIAERIVMGLDVSDAELTAAEWYAAKVPRLEPGSYLCASCRYIIRNTNNQKECEECSNAESPGGQ